jgi:hypothetical protein
MASSGGDTGYEIDQSLMFDKADAASLVRTPGSASNQRTWTWSCWVKRAETHGSHIQTLFSADGNSDNSYICFYLDDIYINDYDYSNGGTKWLLITNRKFLDFSAWYHIVLAVDTTQATASNRLKLYVNGVQETSFSTETYCAQNYDGFINGTLEHHVGTAFTSASNYSLGGQLAEVHFIDGSQLTPSSFGETNSDTGQWIPKKTTGLTYGTNGFYLEFESGALGTDSSGEGNNYTAANLANSDVMLDSPTNNHCTLNGVATGGSIFSQGNLKATTGTNTNRIAVGTISTPSSGKWYWECKPTSLTGGLGIGVGNLGSYQTSVNSYLGNYAGTYLWYAYGGNGWKDVNGSNSSVAQSFAANDVVGVALDVDAGTLTMYKNGSSQLQIASGLSGQFDPVFSDGSGQYVSAFEVNFGQKSFAHTPPSNHLALCSKNLPDPAIKKPTEHFNTVLYTGNETARSITGIGFEPSLVWIKERSAGGSHRIFDQVRGVNKVLQSDADTAELDRTEVTAFNSDGFSLADSVTVNQDGVTHVAWNWKANGAGSANTDGAQTTTVSANTTAGFSIAACTGSGGSTTYGHGLGTTPEIVIIKSRSTADNWYFFTTSIDGSWDYMYLNTTAAKTDTSTIANSTTITTSFVSGVTFIAYSFAEVEGFSKFGSYTGNASADGPFVYCGFRPAWILVRNTIAENWEIYDIARDPVNPTDHGLRPDSSAAEYDQSSNNRSFDILSNGFKVRGTNGGINGSGNTLLFVAFAESPFKYANAR